MMSESNQKYLGKFSHYAKDAIQRHFNTEISTTHKSIGIGAHCIEVYVPLDEYDALESSVKMMLSEQKMPELELK